MTGCVCLYRLARRLSVLRRGARQPRLRFRAIFGYTPKVPDRARQENQTATKLAFDAEIITGTPLVFGPVHTKANPGEKLHRLWLQVRFADGAGWRAHDFGENVASAQRHGLMALHIRPAPTKRPAKKSASEFPKCEPANCSRWARKKCK